MSQTNQELQWNGDLNDDCTAEWMNLTLRAEEMSRGNWWWAVYDSSGEVIDSSNSKVDINMRYKNGEAARTAAEEAARSHLLGSKIAK